MLPPDLPLLPLPPPLLPDFPLEQSGKLKSDDDDEPPDLPLLPDE